MEGLGFFFLNNFLKIPLYRNEKSPHPTKKTITSYLPWMQLSQINHEIIEYTSQDIEYTKLFFGQMHSEL